MTEETKPKRTPAVAPRMLRTPEAAGYLGVSVRTLEDWRYRSGGPACVHIGKLVRYDIKDLDAWIEEHKKAG